MKQKILIRVTMTDDKTRAKAMTVAVRFKGVIAVEIKGDVRNQIEVTGDEVDMICLIKTLRKKVAFAELVSVTKVEPPPPPGPPPGPPGPPPAGPPPPKDGDKKPEEKKPEEKKPEEKKPEEKKPEEPCCVPWPHGYGVPSSYPYHPCDPYLYTGEPVYNHEPNCKIM